jgi:hypothetical protein
MTHAHKPDDAYAKSLTTQEILQLTYQACTHLQGYSQRLSHP